MIRVTQTMWDSGIDALDDAMRAGMTKADLVLRIYTAMESVRPAGYGIEDTVVRALGLPVPDVQPEPVVRGSAEA